MAVYVTHLIFLMTHSYFINIYIYIYKPGDELLNLDRMRLSFVDTLETLWSSSMEILLLRVLFRPGENWRGLRDWIFELELGTILNSPNDSFSFNSLDFEWASVYWAIC